MEIASPEHVWMILTIMMIAAGFIAVCFVRSLPGFADQRDRNASGSLFDPFAYLARTLRVQRALL